MNQVLPGVFVTELTADCQHSVGWIWFIHHGSSFWVLTWVVVDNAAVVHDERKNCEVVRFHRFVEMRRYPELRDGALALGLSITELRPVVKAHDSPEIGHSSPGTNSLEKFPRP